MIRTRSALAAAIIWAVALTWLAVLPHQERAHLLLFAVAIAASTKAAVDGHAAQFREVVQLTLMAASYGENSRVPARDYRADDGDSW